VNQTVGAASALLNTWTRILSQTEHNQRLLLDPAWHGASQDIAEMENEALARQQQVERREMEEQERKAAAVRKAEDEEQKKAEVPTKTIKPATRGRTRTTGRGTSTAQSGYVAGGTQRDTSTSSIARGNTSTRRTTSGIGRGQSSRGARGRT